MSDSTSNGNNILALAKFSEELLNIEETGKLFDYIIDKTSQTQYVFSHAFAPLSPGF